MQAKLLTALLIEELMEAAGFLSSRGTTRQPPREEVSTRA
jgi:hypothetical protein